MKTIKLISEAFSMQPYGIKVGSRISMNPDVILHQIKEEIRLLDGKETDYLIGYDENGKELFQFRKASYNIRFEN